MERSGLVLDLSGAEDAALTVAGREVALADLYGSGEASSTDGRLTARLIMPDKAWMEVTVIDKATGKPTPSRVHFRAPDGHYLPPAGHRQEVNDNWFEDYGADLKLGQTQYAYVGGQFQIQLPEGEVFVEVSKGFEFEPLRTRLNLSRGQREVRIELDRIADSRQEGWITADTHVHFLSPETARLEAQAEGLNIVNLLAAQWGDLYTNVGDLTGAQSGVSADETIVWVGTENRQHFLGHISMLGVQGNPVLPLSTSGPPEGYIGEPTLRAMGEWADECRSKSGLVIAPHFPLPHSEITAEIVRGRVDAVELRDWHGSTMSTFGVDEWYRHLNAGYRVAAVGGTDKMSAGMPVGGVRTYANIGEQPFSYEAWKAAVRAGRTYTTSGPLLTFVVEGQGIGDEIRLPASGGKLEAVATALSIAPIHRLEIVYNGRVVADTSEVEGSHSLRLDAAVDIDQSGWLAARCISGHKAWHVWPIAFGAHTSPVYVVVGDAEVFDREVGQYLITMMEGGLSWLDTLATRGDPARHAAVRSVFTDGIERVRARLHEHPHHHLPPRDRLD